MRLTLARYFTLFLTLFVLFGCASTINPSEDFKDLNAEEMFKAGENAMLKRNYRTAVRYFEALDAQYPFSQYAEQAQLDVVYAYYKITDYASAVAAADRYIHLYPRSKHVDYAYYLRGVSNFEQDRTFLQRYLPIDLSQRDLTAAKQAFSDFNELLRRFPESQYAADARQRMIYLRNLFAKHEVMVARYYMRREAYVAAANRASQVVQHYQGAPEVKQALRIMVAAYKQLGLSKAQAEAEGLLTLNFPKEQA